MNLGDRSFLVAQTNLAKKESLVKKPRNKLKKLEKQVDKAEEELEAAESEFPLPNFKLRYSRGNVISNNYFGDFPILVNKLLNV
jgi:hypothetical protein